MHLQYVVPTYIVVQQQQLLFHQNTTLLLLLLLFHQNTTSVVSPKHNLRGAGHTPTGREGTTPKRFGTRLNRGLLLLLLLLTQTVLYHPLLPVRVISLLLTGEPVPTLLERSDRVADDGNHGATPAA